MVRIGATMETLRCNNCGCQRVTLLSSRVRNQARHLELSLRWLCIPCLLEVLNLSDGLHDKYDYNSAMACVNEDFGEKENDN